LMKDAARYVVGTATVMNAHFSPVFTHDRPRRQSMKEVRPKTLPGTFDTYVSDLQSIRRRT
jgi:hypothetical protein